MKPINAYLKVSINYLISSKNKITIDRFVFRNAYTDVFSRVLNLIQKKIKTVLLVDLAKNELKLFKTTVNFN